MRQIHTNAVCRFQGLGVDWGPVPACRHLFGLPYLQKSPPPHYTWSSEQHGIGVVGVGGEGPDYQGRVQLGLNFPFCGMGDNPPALQTHVKVQVS